MHPLTLLVIVYLITRYLRESDDSGCDGPDGQMEFELADLLDAAWDLVKSCVLWAVLVYSAGCLMLAVIELLGRLLGL